MLHCRKAWWAWNGVKTEQHTSDWNMLDGHYLWYSRKRSKIMTDYRFLMKTNKSEGLIWWECKGHSVRSDYLAIFILAGRVGFAINLGSNPKVKTIGSNTIVSDNKWHSVALVRLVQFLQLWKILNFQSWWRWCAGLWHRSRHEVYQPFPQQAWRAPSRSDCCGYLQNTLRVHSRLVASTSRKAPKPAAGLQGTRSRPREGGRLSAATV